MKPSKVSLRSLRISWNQSLKQLLMFKLTLIWACLIVAEAGENMECREQEYRDQAGNCVACKQCGPGQELSKDCGFGFGYGVDAQCVPCRPNRFKEDWGLQKCKACLDCALVNRLQKSNCTATSNAMCGDCLPGFYRKTKLSGFQDMECIPCGEPPPPYEPNCSNRVNLIRIPSTESSPRDTALAAVICSALATVLLALLILCVIYCKRQFLEKKPSWPPRSPECPYSDAELSCFDRQRMTECCHCQRDPTQTCGPVHLIPSLCCDETCSLERGSDGCPFHSQSGLDETSSDPVEDLIPSCMAAFSSCSRADHSEVQSLMRHSAGSESLPLFLPDEPEAEENQNQNSEDETNPDSPVNQDQPELTEAHSLDIGEPESEYRGASGKKYSEIGTSDDEAK
ncbi:tumor necrosis factor receptor superfamily member 19 isoform X1 [Polypterus senegalus]|uniref:tumor necrosis factor receptor superfamily member 19 isoform X1 n=2 Tax=Polypterus senegalus TaxID=55291 RepID=UPI00196579FF|nr:tumor necrosis factor receptor superfamily member 19 isoform X1 [Polypterus senegalus]XP_039601384.1 tumor necrosis factor receptor superfamily member 19 isoform X1 [Polypterus senegalus]